MRQFENEAYFNLDSVNTIYSLLAQRNGWMLDARCWMLTTVINIQYLASYHQRPVSSIQISYRKKASLAGSLL